MNKPVTNRRVSEATALRGFFQEQWDHLQQLVAEWQEKKARDQEEARNISSAVEYIVETTDSRIRGIGGYHKLLRGSARKLLDHIQGLVADMPSAVCVDRVAVVKDPLIGSLFSDTESLQELFCEDPDVRAYFRSQEHAGREHVYALLFLHRQEKNVFGSEMKGEILLREVQQTSVTFYGHQLLGADPTEAQIRSTMKKILFESVIKHIKYRMTQLRHGQSEEEKRLGALNPDQNINNPVVYMDMLVEQLGLPRRLIKLQDALLRINKMGIKLPLDSKASSDVLRLYEVEVGSELSRISLIVRYPRSEFISCGNNKL